MRAFGKTLPVLLVAAALHGAVRAQDSPVPEAVAPGVWMVQGQSALGSSANRNFISNAGFVITNDGVVVIDALGSPALAEELLAQIRRITPLPVRHVILTHYHADHIYGLQTFKAAGATVIAHRAAGEYLNSETAVQRLKASREELFPWIDENTRVVPADRWIDGPTTLTLGGVEFRLQPAGPSHTPEDMVVYVPALRTLFAGDLVFRGRVPFVGQADSGHWITALDTLLGYDIDIAIPGHGPASKNARADLELTRDYLVHLRRTMGEAARNMEPFEDAYAKADWSRFDKLPLFKAANRINAYNTYLLMEHEAR
ncbi:MBL fold metallo-hydrolase [Immundisolibacter sp.]|uniref:MBL fold metallo-hydrolase n=1 Tax=Immundisolibacter sp. TaxID=1934948 RepID=UPI003D0D5970